MRDKDNQLYYPVRRGIVQDGELDHLTTLLQHIFDKELCLEHRQMNVLMTDSPANDKHKKSELASIMFEHFKVKSFALMNTAVLSMYSSGRVSGLVAEVGEGVAYTVPVF
jgi:actin-related protein